ncbi:hypothetical protein ZWY2020_008675 [Hordeum vulgare]|nr:hypothetical protein ZWY2020_008675 [Hordeum vulgare]
MVSASSSWVILGSVPRVTAADADLPPGADLSLALPPPPRIAPHHPPRIFQAAPPRTTTRPSSPPTPPASSSSTPTRAAPRARQSSTPPTIRSSPGARSSRATSCSTPPPPPRFRSPSPSSSCTRATSASSPPRGVAATTWSRLWWVDLSWCLLTCDPFQDAPVLRAVPLPPGKVLKCREGWGLLDKYRCVRVSGGKLRFLDMYRNRDSRGSAQISVWTLADPDTTEWTLEYEAAFTEIWDDASYKATGSASAKETEDGVNEELRNSISRGD